MLGFIISMSILHQKFSEHNKKLLASNSNRFLIQCCKDIRSYLVYVWIGYIFFCVPISLFNLFSESDTVCCMPNHASLADQFSVWNFLIWNCHFALLESSMFICVSDICSPFCGHIYLRFYGSTVNTIYFWMISKMFLSETDQLMHAVCLTRTLLFCRLSPSFYLFTAPMVLV